jgi:hypothetical protein
MEKMTYEELGETSGKQWIQVSHLATTPFRRFIPFTMAQTGLRIIYVEI